MCLLYVVPPEVNVEERCTLVETATIGPSLAVNQQAASYCNDKLSVKVKFCLTFC